MITNPPSSSLAPGFPTPSIPHPMPTGTQAVPVPDAAPAPTDGTVVPPTPTAPDWATQTPAADAKPDASSTPPAHSDGTHTRAAEKDRNKGRLHYDKGIFKEDMDVSADRTLSANGVKLVKTEPAGMSAAELAAVKRAIASLVGEGVTGYETDVRININGQLRDVTVKIAQTNRSEVFTNATGAKESMKVKEAQVTLHPPRAGAAAGTASGNDQVRNDFKIKLQGSWKPDDLQKLHESLSTLNAQERKEIQGLTFARVGQIAGKPNGAGEYDPNTGTIQIADGAFVEDGSRFAGDAMRRLPYSSLAILHEVGHAIADHARFKAVQDRKAAGDFKAMDAADKALQAAQGREDKDGNYTRRVENFLAHVDPQGTAKDILPFTDYATDAWKKDKKYEFFAEAFALFKADPTFLKENYPTVHKWFEDGKHLKH